MQNQRIFRPAHPNVLRQGALERPINSTGMLFVDVHRFPKLFKFGPWTLAGSSRCHLMLPPGAPRCALTGPHLEIIQILDIFEMHQVSVWLRRMCQEKASAIRECRSGLPSLSKQLRGQGASVALGILILGGLVSGTRKQARS